MNVDPVSALFSLIDVGSDALT